MVRVGAAKQSAEEAEALGEAAGRALVALLKALFWGALAVEVAWLVLSSAYYETLASAIDQSGVGHSRTCSC